MDDGRGRGGGGGGNPFGGGGGGGSPFGNMFGGGGGGGKFSHSRDGRRGGGKGGPGGFPGGGGGGPPKPSQASKDLRAFLILYYKQAGVQKTDDQVKKMALKYANKPSELYPKLTLVNQCICFSTENLLENTDGVGAPHQCSLGTAPC